jgi:hypothetical protein
MKKLTTHIYLIFFVCLLAALGCNAGTDQSGKVYSCNTNADCIPKPGCHPTECINQKYEKLFGKPNACTEIFMSQAAYAKEDCACIEGMCTNKNMASEKIDYTEQESQDIASEYIKQSSTYEFDGSNLKFIESSPLKCAYCWNFVFEFKSSHPGYGDRSGQALAKVITSHKAIILVTAGKVSTAILDNTWDMIRQNTINAPSDALPDEEIPNGEDSYLYCETDADCACGTSIITGDCSYGNAKYIDTTEQCPDFCSGIAANLGVVCIANTCKHVQIPR